MGLPNVTPRITPKEWELSRVQENLAQTVDAILSF